MQKTILVAINAKFIHTNVAIQTLKHYCTQPMTTLEFTINDSFHYILSEIHATAPTIIGFSCYIWNIQIVRNLVDALKKILPSTLIILGGPEVSYDAEALLKSIPADIIVRGEGEETLNEILNENPLASIIGITYRNELGNICSTSPREKLNPHDMVFPYSDDNLPENKIIYYESSRGCPFSCGYCLSYNEKPVRLISLPQVKKSLDFFLTHRVKQVKFIDRTFNCDRNRAVDIWQYLIDNDNGFTNFHFEIAPHLLDESAFQCLTQAPEGLFQFEMGIQSTHEETLTIIQRETNTAMAIANIYRLGTLPTMHQHLDLIAGLPNESYAQFAQSFNAVFALKPDMLQLGFLKLLKGSDLRKNAENLGIIYHHAPPYEVLETPHMDYASLTRLKAIESALDKLYNSGHFKQSVPYIISFFSSPFHFFESFADFWKSNNYHHVSQSLVTMYEIFAQFALPLCNEWVLANLLKYDWHAAGNQKSLPIALLSPLEENAEQIAALYKSTNTSRRFPIKKFTLNPLSDERAMPTNNEVFHILFEPAGKKRPGAQNKTTRVTVLCD